MTKPEPSELTLRDAPSFSWSSKKSLNRSSKGDPLGPDPGDELLSREPLRVCVVATLTTVFCGSSAIGAPDAGPRAKLAVLSIAGTARSRAEAPAHRPKRISAPAPHRPALPAISSAPDELRI